MYKLNYVIGLIVCVVLPVMAQNTIDTLKSVQQDGVLLRQSVFEGPIDPEKYVVGPGDQLTLQVIGTLESSLTITISPEGIAQIPTVGQVNVVNKKLAEVERLIVNIAKPRYPNAELKVTLLKARLFYASVAGAVVRPGRYMVSAASRVSDLLEMAGGAKWDLTPPDTTQEGKVILPPFEIAPLRGLILARKNGDTVWVDLERFYRFGEVESNPFMLDGDRLYIPYWTDKTGTVRIAGAVYKQLLVRYLPNDKLRTIMNLSGGFLPDARGDVQLIRFNENGERIIREFSNEWVKSNDLGPDLKPNDFIFVQYKKDLTRRGSVQVEGEVYFPGVYAVDEKTVRLSDVLELTGGFTEKANVAEVTVIRRSLMAIPDPEYNRLFGMARIDMNWNENEYLKAKRRDLEPRVVVNVEKILRDGKGSIQDIILIDGDLIKVPKKNLSVKVLGQVVKPGLIPYKENEKFKYYIRQAGGYTFKARTSKIRIIKASSGQWLKPGATTIEAGDTIFIPEKPETDWWATTKDLLSVFSQIATIALVVYTINKG